MFKSVTAEGGEFLEEVVAKLETFVTNLDEGVSSERRLAILHEYAVALHTAGRQTE